MKALLCDNSISAVEYMEQLADWESLGFDEILRAYSGNTAQYIIASERPDIILCGMDLPRCSGMDVLRFMKEQRIHSQFAFFTRHKSFELIQEALRLGASDYIIKPASTEELHASLKRMISRSSEVTSAATAPASDAIIINNALRCIWEGSYGSERSKVLSVLRRDRVPLDIDSKWHTLFINADTIGTRDLGWERELLRYGLNFLAQEVISERTDFAYLLSNSHDQFEFIVVFIDAAQVSEGQLVQRCRKYVKLCSEQFSVLPMCVISDPLPLYQLTFAYHEMSDKAYGARMRKGNVFLCREIDNNAEDSTEDNSVYYSADILQDYVRIQDKNKFIEYVESSVRRITDSSSSINLHIFSLHEDLLRIFADYAEHHGVSEAVLMSDAQIRAISANAERSEYDMLQFADAIFDRTALLVSTAPGHSDVTARVKSYIRLHYSEDISREQLAEYAHVSPNYLSKRFRIDTGISITQYINQTRIDRAKKLLLATDFTIDAISSKVGFDSQSYFSSVFRKQCGCSPVSWRAEAREGITE